MGYNKFIRYGENLELFEYEKDIYNSRINTGKRRKDKKECVRVDLVDGGKNVLQAEQLGKRQDSARRAGVAFRRLIKANLSRLEFPLLLTLTFAENETSLQRGYRVFTNFISALRRRYGDSFKYVCVPEFQKRGAVHFHALVWGLPSSVYSTERDTRFLFKLWKVGFVYLKETDGNEKLSSYLTKYMSKAFLDPRLKNKRLMSQVGTL